MDKRVQPNLGLDWTNRFTQLGSSFFTRLQPTPLPNLHWISVNNALARELGLHTDWDRVQGVLEALGGSQILHGSDPLASVYSGHQFGHWAGQLGDGRAIYLGEVKSALPSATAPMKNSYELQLKGAGPTPYSRSGDGRAVLRSSIREYLCSEAMHALGIPTTRALCLVGSTGVVYREERESAAVVCRASPSFIRFGHFEHFAARGATQQLKELADFVIKNYTNLLEDPSENKYLDSLVIESQAKDASSHPATDDVTSSVDQNEGNPPYTKTKRTISAAATVRANPYALMLARVTLKTARLIAHWQSVGFCHGVMNTDNMSILGLTLDYGPFQMMDAFIPNHICNHTDHSGRYAFDQQPSVAYWNLYCLGQALLPLIQDNELAVACLDIYKQAYPDFMLGKMLKKLGVPENCEVGSKELQELSHGVQSVMAQGSVDFTLFWRRLSHSMNLLGTDDLSTDGVINNHKVQSAFQSVREMFNTPQALNAFDVWTKQYLELLLRCACDPRDVSKRMLQCNPKYILRNHLGELAIRAAKEGDFSEIQILLKILSSPFEEHPEFESYAALPPDWACSISISCSS